MQTSHTTKPATADTVNGLLNIDLAGRRIDAKHSLSVLQAQRLAARFRISVPHAAVVAAYLFSEVAA